MAYVKGIWIDNVSPASSARLNNLEKQYDEVKAELAKTTGLSDIQAHGSNLVAGSVTAAKVAADVATQAELDTHSALSSSETVKAHVELATAAETTTGTDNTRAVHPAGLKVELDKKLNLAGGTMTGPVNFDDANNFIDKIGIVGMTMRSDTRSRIEGKTIVDMAQNAYFDGTNWMRFDIALPSIILEAAAGSVFQVYRAVAGANPITWSDPYTVWHAGNDGAGSGLDADLLDGFHASSFAPAISAAAKVTHSAANVLADSVYIALAFDTERFDTDAMHDNVTNNSRLTCKTAGKYLITAGVSFQTNATGYRRVDLLLNGSFDPIASHITNATSGTVTNMQVTTIYNLAVNDYVEVFVTQTSGGSLNVAKTTNHSPEFSMVKVG